MANTSPRAMLRVVEIAVHVSAVANSSCADSSVHLTRCAPSRNRYLLEATSLAGRVYLQGLGQERASD